MYSMLVIRVKGNGYQHRHVWLVLPYSGNVKEQLLSAHRSMDTFVMAEQEVRNLATMYLGLRDGTTDCVLYSEYDRITTRLCWLVHVLGLSPSGTMDVRASVEVYLNVDTNYDDKDFVVRCSNCGDIIFCYSPEVKRNRMLCRICC